MVTWRPTTAGASTTGSPRRVEPGRMEIANPIYDAAFKYLMQDDRAARLLVGRIARTLSLDPEQV